MNENESSYFIYPISLVGLGAIAFFAAANRALPLASFALISLALMLAIRLWGKLSLRRLDISLACDAQKLFAGETLSVRAQIANRKALPLWLRLEIAAPVGGAGIESLAGADSELSGETGLLPFGEISGAWQFRALRRGVYTLGPAFAQGGDLLGIYRCEKKLPDTWDIVIYPRRVALRQFDLPFRDYFGIHPSKGIIEDPAWYEGTREYTGNRPARTIHWKASARLGKLQEKIFEPTSHQKIFFLFEGLGFRRAEDRMGFERALEVLGALANRFAESGASFGIATDCAVKGFPAILPLGRGPEHLGMLLELLARCEFERGQSIAELIGSVGAAGAGFLIVARAPDESTDRFFALPSARRNRVYFVFARANDGTEVEGELEARTEGGAVPSMGAAPDDTYTDEATEKGLRYPALYFDDLVREEAQRPLSEAGRLDLSGYSGEAGHTGEAAP
ncbi:hypothetical protein SPIRO4BDMA_50189 [uncultured spirochete]|uniref:Uncharacterized protein n=1 Tax=uncultured spirochete TaxID=156406 RepID=A0A3P3XR69_9SPIR|nr:hypothetical protein SPIRO4BDMA_50189 [uncultured spirochete]